MVLQDSKLYSLNPTCHPDTLTAVTPRLNSSTKSRSYVAEERTALRVHLANHNLGGGSTDEEEGKAHDETDS